MRLHVLLVVLAAVAVVVAEAATSSAPRRAASTHKRHFVRTARCRRHREIAIPNGKLRRAAKATNLYVVKCDRGFRVGRYRRDTLLRCDAAGGIQNAASAPKCLKRLRKKSGRGEPDGDRARRRKKADRIRRLRKQSNKHFQVDYTQNALYTYNPPPYKRSQSDDSSANLVEPNRSMESGDWRPYHNDVVGGSGGVDIGDSERGPDDIDEEVVLLGGGGETTAHGGTAKADGAENKEAGTYETVYQEEFESPGSTWDFALTIIYELSIQNAVKEYDEYDETGPSAGSGSGEDGGGDYGQYYDYDYDPEAVAAEREEDDYEPEEHDGESEDEGDGEEYDEVHYGYGNQERECYVHTNCDRRRK